jgi:hypothetical protein
MEIHDRAEALRADVKKYAKHEGAALMAANWHGKVGAQRNSVAKVRKARKTLLEMIDEAEAPVAGPAALDPARAAFAQMQVDVVGALVEEPNSVENRLAKASEMQRFFKDQRRDLERIGTTREAEVSAQVLWYVEKAKTVSAFFVDLAKEPMKYAKAALDFANGKVRGFLIKYISKALGKATSWVASKLGTTMLQADEAAAYAAYLAIESGRDITQFPRVAAALEKVTTVLKVSVVCVQVVTTFFAEMAQRNSWANAVAKGAVIGTFTAATIWASAAIEGMVAAGLALTKVGAAIPKLGIVLIAAGLVILATAALAKMFDSLVTLIFGSLSIDPSMRLPMSSTMVARMSGEMDSPMAASMLPD